MASKTTALIAAALLTACSDTPGGNKPSVLEPENRFGNDPELVADFENLKTCIYRDHRIDRSCAYLRALQRRLRTRLKEPKRRDKASVTLANLLESRRELTRLVAADSLYPYRRQPAVQKALRRALAVEKQPRIKATLLRQACQTPLPQARQAALELLSPQQPEPVQREAVFCLANLPAAKQTKVTHQALLAALDARRKPSVRAAACTALGPWASEAVSSLVPLLEDPKLSPSCSSALARIGTKNATEALLATATKLEGAGKLPAQLVSALGSLEQLPQPEAVRRELLFKQIALSNKQSIAARSRALLALPQESAAFKEASQKLAAAEASEADRVVLQSVSD